MNSMRCSWRNSGSFGAYDMKIKIKSDNLRRERNIGGNSCLTYIYVVDSQKVSSNIRGR